MSPPVSSPSDFMVGIAIGEGAFGNVVFGRHKASRREVAIKVVPKLLLEKQPTLFASIVQERNILTRCNDSPLVLSLYASFHDEQCLYLVMECATRGTLGEEIETAHTNEDWTTRVVPYYVRQLLQALEYLHEEQRIIHADLKPENILVSESGNLQLCDFGSAIDMSSKSNDENTTTSIPRGTTDYAAPELLNNATSFMPAIDLWSFGCIIYCMLHSTHASPFHAASDALCIDKIMSYVRNYTSENGNSVTVSAIPEDYKSLVQQLLHPDPTKRGAASLILSQNHEMLEKGSNQPLYVPPHASWYIEAQSTPMRDGSQGWQAFLVD